MSTNYYARTANTPAGENGLHIGQHAVGWEFLFRAHPDRGLTNCSAWHTYLSRPEVTIVTEAGTQLTMEAFWPGATQRPAEAPRWMRSRFIGVRRRPDETKDAHGHPFQATEFC